MTILFEINQTHTLNASTVTICTVTICTTTICTVTCLSEYYLEQISWYIMLYIEQVLSYKHAK